MMERSLGKTPTPEELKYRFNPGVRFYFNYIDLVGHPRFCSDGYHYCKVKDSIDLNDYMVVAIAPESTRVTLSKATDLKLRNRLSFINRDKYTDLNSWSQNACRTASEHKEK